MQWRPPCSRQCVQQAKLCESQAVSEEITVKAAGLPMSLTFLPPEESPLSP